MMKRTTYGIVAKIYASRLRSVANLLDSHVNNITQDQHSKVKDLYDELHLTTLDVICEDDD